MGRIATRPDVVTALQERDFVYLTDLVRNAAAAEDRAELADILLDLLAGKIRRPAHRPAKQATEKDGLKIAWRVIELTQNGWSKKGAAVRQAATEFSCRDRKVWGCLKQLSEYVRYKEDDHARLVRHHLQGLFTDEEMQQAGDEFEDWLAEHGDDPEPTDEEIEAAGDAYMQWVIDFARGK